MKQYRFFDLIMAVFVAVLVVNTLKKTESEDYYDHETNFNPFVV